QLLNTQNFLLGAQNDLYTTWGGILTTRMNFYRDIGIMPIDSRGVWIDDIATCQCQPTPAERPAEQPPAANQPTGRDGGRPDQLPEPRTLTPPPSAPLDPKR